MSAAPMSIAVVGGGQVALLAATALKRALPAATIKLVRTPVHPAALADHMPVGFPGLLRLHKRIGITERSLLERAGASHWLATRYSAADAAHFPFIVGHGAASPLPSQHGGIAAALAAVGRFALPSDDPASPLSDLDYGIRFDVGTHVKALLALVDHLGIPVLVAENRTVGRSDADRVEAIEVAGKTVAADLFVDCTGPNRLLTSARDWISWQEHHPFDRCAFVTDRAENPASPLDEIHGFAGGISIESRGRNETLQVHCWSAKTALPAASAGSIAIDAGTVDRHWIGNTIALGDAAASFAPVGWSNLHLATIGIERLIELIPASFPTMIESQEYNRRMALATGRVGEYVEAHTGLSGLSQSPSPALARTLTEFTRRRRIVPVEDDPITLDLWQQFLGGLLPEASPSPHYRAVLPGALKVARAAEAARQAHALALSTPYPEALRKILGERR